MSPSPASTYHLKRGLRHLGLLGGLFFAAIGVLSIVVSLLNPDGSLQRPVLAALVFGVFFGSFTGLFAWLFYTHRTYRLHLSESQISQLGPARSCRVSPAEISQALWRTRPRGGSLQLQTATSRFVIEFDLFTRTDRAAVIETLRQIIPTHLQHNWGEFHSRFEAPSPERLQQQQRARSLLRMALLAFAVAFGALGVLGAGAQYLLISAINVGVLIWLKFSSTDISGTTMPYPDSQQQTS